MIHTQVSVSDHLSILYIPEPLLLTIVIHANSSCIIIIVLLAIIL